MADQASTPDVFISYSQRDRVIAGEVAAFLTDCGYKVWWDYELVGGTQFRKEIKDKLGSAKAALVIWTPNSVESRWVVEEAEEALMANKLTATRVDDLPYRSIPLGFRGVQTDIVTERERILKALEGLGLPPPRRPQGAAPGAPAAAIDATALARLEQLEQMERWEAIKSGRDHEAFAQFLKRYPNGNLAALARTELNKLGNDAWQRIGGAEDLAALEQFVRHFPDHLRAAEARQTIQLLQLRKEEEGSWETVKASDNVVAVEAHILRYPGGRTAVLARELLQRLQRERHAADHWRAIETSDQIDVFDQFIEAYPESAHAAKARIRRDVLRSAREEDDWQTVPFERHPAPILRFLRRYPQGRHAAEAAKLLYDLPRTIEDEAWAEIRDSADKVVFEAFVAAYPHSVHTDAARARLGRPAPAAAATTAQAAPADRQPRPTAKETAASETAAAQPRAKPAGQLAWQRNGLWIALAFLVLLVFVNSLGALDSMLAGAVRPVADYLLLASILAFAAAALAVVFVPRLYPAAAATKQTQRRVLAFAAGAVALMVWMLLVQMIGETRHRLFGSDDNIRRNSAVVFAIVGGGILVAAVIALLLPKLRLVLHAAVLAAGVALFIAERRFMSGFVAVDYWVTVLLTYFGGIALIGLALIALGTEAMTLRAKWAVGRGPPASEAVTPTATKLWLVWGGTAALTAIASATSVVVLGLMGSDSAAQAVSLRLWIGTAAMTGAAFLMTIVGPRAHRMAGHDASQRRLLFSALGMVALLGWAAATHTLGEPLHRLFGGIDNIARGNQLLPIALVVVIGAAALSFYVRWLRYLFYGVAVVPGMVLAASHFGFLNGLIARDYWVTTILTFASGVALLALAGFAAIREIWIWRRAARG